MILAAAVLVTLLASWGFKQKSPQTLPQAPAADTIPQRQEKKSVNLDEAIAELDAAGHYLDADRLKKQLAEVMEQVNEQKISAHVQKAMTEAQRSIQAIKWEELKKDAERSIASINWEALRKDIEAAQFGSLTTMEKELKKVNLELEKIGPQVEKAIEKVKAEMADYKVLVDGLHADGLLDKNQDYTIEHKDGQLQVNGKTMPAATYTKYRSVLEKHTRFTLKKTKESFTIDNDRQ